MHQELHSFTVHRSSGILPSPLFRSAEPTWLAPWRKLINTERRRDVFLTFYFFFFFNVQTRSSNRTSQCDIRNETNLLEQFSTLLSLRTINRSSRIVFLLDFFREREREGQYLSKTEEEEEEERSGEGKKVVEIS